MEELVNKLAELQAKQRYAEGEAESASMDVDEMIRSVEVDLMDLKKKREELRKPHIEAAKELQTTIEDISAQIIEAWSGEKKTLKFDAGTLKFRTTSKLEIYHPEILLADMFVHLQTGSQMLKYLSGFNKTAVKKYIGVHPQDTDIVELIATTSVKLETGGA